MTIVINRCFGGFHIPAPMREAYGMSRHEDIDRTDARLVDFIKGCPGRQFADGGCKLVPVTIPDCATDWELDEYDGMERIIYVVDGKIHHAIG